MSHVLYSTMGRSATWLQLDGGAEHAAYGWDDAELQPVAATDLDQLREHRLVDRLRREDDAVDAGRATLQPVDLLDGEVGTLGEHTHVDVAEELELPSRRAPRAAPVPTMTARSGGVDLSPGEAHAAAEDERAAATTSHD